MVRVYHSHDENEESSILIFLFVFILENKINFLSLFFDCCTISKLFITREKNARRVQGHNNSLQQHCLFSRNPKTSILKVHRYNALKQDCHYLKNNELNENADLIDRPTIEYQSTQRHDGHMQNSAYLILWLDNKSSQKSHH